jgi:outer membrane protein assembly factor BamB
VFLPSQDGGLYAVDARSGDVIWRFKTLGPVQSEPVYDPEEDVVYFGSTDGALYKVTAQKGDLIYRFSTNAEIARRAVIADDTVFVTNANDTLVSLDRKTGKMRWYQHRTPAFGIEIGGHAGVAVGQGKAFTAFSEGVVMAYNTSDGARSGPRSISRSRPRAPTASPRSTSTPTPRPSSARSATPRASSSRTTKVACTRSRQKRAARSGATIRWSA